MKTLFENGFELDEKAHRKRLELVHMVDLLSSPMIKNARLRKAMFMLPCFFELFFCRDGIYGKRPLTGSFVLSSCIEGQWQEVILYEVIFLQAFGRTGKISTKRAFRFLGWVFDLMLHCSNLGILGAAHQPSHVRRQPTSHSKFRRPEFSVFWLASLSTSQKFPWTRKETEWLAGIPPSLVLGLWKVCEASRVAEVECKRSPLAQRFWQGGFEQVKLTEVQTL